MAKTHNWQAGPFRVRFKVGRSASGVTVRDAKGARLYFQPFTWEPSKCDALMLAAHYKKPDRATSVLSYLFSRIDGCAGRPGLMDAWEHAVYLD